AAAGAPDAARAQIRRGLPAMAQAATRPDVRRDAPGGKIAAGPVIAVSSGEPAGIGPEICVKLARERFDARLVYIGDRGLLEGCPEIEHVSLVRPASPGRLDTANASYVLKMLDRGIDGCISGEYN